MPQLVLLALLLCLGSAAPASAARLNGCDTSWPIGSRVVRKGDDLGRTLKVIRANDHRLRWLRGPSGRHWTLEVTGHNPRTVHIRTKQGRISELCQYSH